MDQTLNELRVCDVMLADPPTIGGGTTLRQAALLLWRTGAESLLVVADDGAVMGFLSERELVFGAEAQWQGQSVRAGEHVCPRFVSARPDERFVDLLQRMADEAVKRAVVVDDRGAPVGMVSLAGGVVLGDVAEERTADALVSAPPPAAAATGGDRCR